MDIEMAPPAYTPREGKSVTFAEVATKITDLSGDRGISHFKDALAAFRTFLTHEEGTNLPKDQLKVLRSRFVSVLEECARHPDGDADKILPTITEALENVSNELESSKRAAVLDQPNTSKNIEGVVDKAFEVIDTQRREVIQGKAEEESNIYKEELIQAQAKDRKKIEELEGIVGQLRESNETIDQRVQDLMQEQLKIIGDASEGRPRQEHAKQVLALIAELTGQSLPPSTLLDRQFVSIGKTAINQGNSYDIFLGEYFTGEYFTGEKIAIKVLRQRVSGDTVQKMHERFARQTMNWASLRHDSILPFYGIGVMGSPVSEGEFQMYTVSPYLQHQDVQRYLKKYELTSPKSRLKMIYDIARGLQYLNENSRLGKNDFVLSELDPSNILIKDSGHAVLSGSGHAKIFEGSQWHFAGNSPNFRYMGPELINESILTHGSDIWAWAMTSLEILTDEPPYGKKTNGPQIIQRLSLGRKPKRRDHPKIEEYRNPDALWEILERCWELNSEDRPGASDLVSSLRPLLQQLDRKQDLNVPIPPARSPHQPHSQNGPPPSEVGRGDPSIQSGNSPQHASGQQQFAWVSKPTVHDVSPPSSAEKTLDSISRTMTIDQVIEILGQHQCPNLTSNLDLSRCSRHPVAGGGFGDVYEGWLHTNVKVAIKCPRLFIGPTQEENDALKSMAHEMYAWSKCKHPNVLELLGLVEFQGQMCIVSPWMEHGKLPSYLSSKPESIRYRICAQIATGLAYLHMRDIVHGDLKADNIVVSKSGDIKLADFGNTILKTYTLKFTGVRNALGLSLRWSAPEILDEGGGISSAGDVYALGMTILEVITGQVPYANVPNSAIPRKVVDRREIPERPVSFMPIGNRQADVLWSLLVQCWAYEAKDRPAAAEVEKAFVDAMDARDIQG